MPLRELWAGQAEASEWNRAYERITLNGPLTVTLVSDGGPWAVHDMPCPVCLDRTAVVDLSGGGFGPCGACQQAGWRLTRARRPWWKLKR